MLPVDFDFVINEQYKVVLDQQFEEVDKRQKKIQLLFSEYFGTAADHYVPLNNIIKKFNRFSIFQLMSSKGLVYDIQQKQEGLIGKDVSKIIQDVNNLIKKNIEFQTTVESIIKSEIGEKLSQLQITNSVISETIENLYTALRSLKKVNKKSFLQTSDLAKDAVSRSSKTLEKATSQH